MISVEVVLRRMFF